MKPIPKLSNAQSARLGKAAAVVDDLALYAQQIHRKHYNDEPNPAILPALIQALATAYAAQVHAAKG